jgi:hypothetical protein
MRTLDKRLPQMAEDHYRRDAQDAASLERLVPGISKIGFV